MNTKQNGIYNMYIKLTEKLIYKHSLPEMQEKGSDFRLKTDKHRKCKGLLYLDNPK